MQGEWGGYTDCVDIAQSHLDTRYKDVSCLGCNDCALMWDVIMHSQRGALDRDVSLGDHFVGLGELH